MSDIFDPGIDFVFETRTFRDGSGRTVIRNQALKGKPPANFAEWVGQGTIEIPMGDGVHQEPVAFQIEATDVASAFLAFDEAYKTARPGIIAEIRQRYFRRPTQLVNASGAPLN